MKIFLFLLLLIVGINWFSWKTSPELQTMAEAYYRAERVGDLPPKAFMTDSCTLFPDSIGSYDWGEVCLKHDMAYWAGGTKEERMKADEKFKEEINSLIPKLGDAMWLGVKIGGGPYIPTWWRWGYGWPYGRSYE